jgi:hypothetical protein
LRISIYIYFLSWVGNCKVVPVPPGLGPGLKVFYTGPEQFFMQYIFTFIILTWLTMIKSNIFICYSHKNLYWFRICLQGSEFSKYTDFWTHIEQPKQHCIRKFNSFVLWPFLYLLSYQIIVNTYTGWRISKFTREQTEYLQYGSTKGAHFLYQWLRHVSTPNPYGQG